MSEENKNRFVIAGVSSGSGKTFVSCAIMRAMQKKKMNVHSYKCGPDYIDPLFHKHILGLDSVNLDSFFTDEDQLRNIFVKNAGDCNVIEGVMGLFDGIEIGNIRGSTYHVSMILACPVILVVNCDGMSGSIVPIINGFLRYDSEKLIKGIFLNKISSMIFEKIKIAIENECGVKVLGYLPKKEKYLWKSRHLGLFLPNEISDLNEQTEDASDFLLGTFDFDSLNKILHQNINLSESNTLPVTNKFSVKIAVAYDECFCFYYKENLSLLKNLGADIIYFSPLHDSSIPDNIHGLLIGGGYPENYARELEENVSMKKSICNAIEMGMPVLAECGGFMYLQEKIRKSDSEVYEMCCALKGESFFAGKLVRFGYAIFTENDTGMQLKGHEFHYYDSTCNGDSFVAEKPSGRKWSCMVEYKNVLAGFPHLCYYSNTVFAENFLRKCMMFSA